MRWATNASKSHAEVIDAHFQFVLRRPILAAPWHGVGGFFRVTAQLSARVQGKDHPLKYPTLYRTIQIDGLSIFYREAATGAHFVATNYAHPWLALLLECSAAGQNLWRC